MSLVETIQADVTAAMKAGDKARVGALRLVLSELQKDAKEASVSGGKPGGPDRGDSEAVLRRERKRRRESETAFREAGRTELADAEAYEAGLIEAYLPAELSDEELQALVHEGIAATDASSPQDMGKVMKHVMAASGGRADGRKVSQAVKEALA